MLSEVDNQLGSQAGGSGRLEGVETGGSERWSVARIRSKNREPESVVAEGARRPVLNNRRHVEVNGRVRARWGGLSRLAGPVVLQVGPGVPRERARVPVARERVDPDVRRYPEVAAHRGHVQPQRRARDPA